MKNKSRFFMGAILLVIGIISINLFASENLTINRESAYLRSGPGSYYPPKATLPQGYVVVLIEDKDAWLNVQADTIDGFISRKVTEGKKESEDLFAEIGSQKAITEISQIGMTAGIKAMSGKFSKKIDEKIDFIDEFLSYHIDPYKFEQFRDDTYRSTNLKKIQKSVKLPRFDAPQFFTFSEEAMGFAIANKIAELGLYHNTSLQDYINYVGLLVAQASDSYDIPYKFFILDLNVPNAYSCPGGIVFITTGMLQAIANEAELAAVLAHEIAHVSHYHGMQELEKRKVQIIAEDSFAELDELSDELYGHDEKYDDVEAELEDIALSIYETIYQGRLEEYEEEADGLALLYTARAGYYPNALEHILMRLILLGKASNNEHYTQDQIGWRKDLVEEKLENMSLPKGLQYWEDRYLQKTKSLSSSKY
ncbi:MAG: M48 family metalloprotease [Candidatus Cloacimonetes bacterium]|nr:M48 family metalloprotease [Candidatus Cloacimonadota bacterium]